MNPEQANTNHANRQLLRIYSIGTGGVGLIYGLIGSYFGWHLIAMLMYAYSLLVFTNLTVSSRTGSDLKWHLYFILGVGFCVPFVFQYLAGGAAASGTAIIWSTIPLLMSIIYLGGKRSLLAIAAVTLGFASMLYVDPGFSFNGTTIIDERYGRNLLATNIIVVTMMTGYLFHQYLGQRRRSIKKLHLLRETLFQRNSELENSLSYAMRIQKALTADLSTVTGLFDDHFQYVYQKEKVGGDTLWIGREQDRVIIAMIDCTGHGVPGSMLTVLVNDVLNETVHFMGITDPATIIEQMLTKLQVRLGTSEELWNDNADIGLISMNKRSGEVLFSGAGIDLLVQRESTGVEMISGQSTVIDIEQFQDRRQRNVRIPVDQHGTSMYLFTDGVTDLFGGPDHSRFGLTRLLDLIERIHGLPFNLQKRMVLNDLQTWCPNSKDMTDDTSIIGFSLDKAFLSLSSQRDQLSA